MDADLIRASLINILVIDSLIIFAIFYFKPFEKIKNWIKTYRQSRAEPNLDSSQTGHDLGVDNAANDILEGQPEFTQRVKPAIKQVAQPILSENNLSKAP